LTWTVEFDDQAAKELRKLDKNAQREILRYFRERISTDEPDGSVDGRVTIGSYTGGYTS